MKNTQKAIDILNDAALLVAKSGEPGSNMKINTLHNAIVYLLTGHFGARRGVAGLWSTIEVEA